MRVCCTRSICLWPEVYSCCGFPGSSLCRLIPTLLETPSSSPQPQRKKRRICPHICLPDHTPTTHQHMHTTGDILSKALLTIENVITENIVTTAGTCILNYGSVVQCLVPAYITSVQELYTSMAVLDAS